MAQIRHGVNSILSIPFNRLIQTESIASVTDCGLRLETAMAPTVNRGWQLLTNSKYRKLFLSTQRLRLVFQLNNCVFLKDLTQYFYQDITQ